LVINITTVISQQEISDVLDIINKNPHLKLYVYDRKQKQNIVRFCDNKKAKEILGKGSSYVNSGAYLSELSNLALDQHDSSKTPNTLADKARALIEKQKFLFNFST